MDTKSTMRRAASLTVAAGAIAFGAALTPAPASAATLQQAHASVLMKVTPAGSGAGAFSEPSNACCNNGICNCKPNALSS